MRERETERASGDGQRPRVGSMTRAMRAHGSGAPGPRSLRWALVKNGCIVRDEVRAPGQGLEIGPSGDVVAPRAARIFQRDGVWVLSWEEGLEGRLDDGELASLGHPSLGHPSDVGRREHVLSRRARGRIELGDGAVLLSLVDPPAPRAPLPLPPALRGGLVQRTDWAFTAFVSASFCAHLALVAFLMHADWPVEPFGIPPDRIAQVIFVEPEEPVEVPIEDGETEVADADEAPSDDGPEDSADTPPPDRPSRPREATSPTYAEVDVDAVTEGVHAMLGAVLGREGSAVQDLLRNGGVSVDQESVMAQVDATNVASVNPTALAMRSGRDTVPGGDALGRLTRRGRDGEVPLEEGRELREVVVTIRQPRLEELEPIGPVTWDPRELHRLLGLRMPAVRRCYEHELTRGGVTGGGRITLSMRVMPVGTLASVHAEGNSTGSTALAECATRSIQNVRVRVGPEAPVEVHYPVIFSRQE